MDKKIQLYNTEQKVLICLSKWFMILNLMLLNY